MDTEEIVTVVGEVEEVELGVDLDGVVVFEPGGEMGVCGGGFDVLLEGEDDDFEVFVGVYEAGEVLFVGAEEGLGDLFDGVVGDSEDYVLLFLFATHGG